MLGLTIGQFRALIRGHEAADLAAEERQLHLLRLAWHGDGADIQSWTARRRRPAQSEEGDVTAALAALGLREVK